jgi:hypothetical protein
MEFIRGTQTRFGQAGNIGGIPPEYVAEKYMTTQLVEPETLLYDHFRNTLKDTTCEPPSFESDQPRYDNGARNLLNVMHHGSRSQVKPDHPEIYIANTEGDRRGTQNLPDFYQLRKATEDRMRFKDLRSTVTSDQSIDSGVWSPHAINQAMRGTWKGLKAREKWFSRSLSAGAAGVGVTHDTRGSRLDYIQADDEKHHDLAEVTTQVFTPSEVVFGRGYTPVIVGARHVPTHEFHVAKYGDMPRSKQYKYDASKNQFKAVATAEFQRSEELTLKGLAKVMSKEAGCVAANPTNAWDESSLGMDGRHVGKQANVRKALDSAEHTQTIVEGFVMEAESKRARASTAEDMKQRRLHQLIDPEIYGDTLLGKHVSIKLIDDPFTIAYRRQHQLVEHEADPSMEIPSYASAPLPTQDQMRRARDSRLIEYDREESMRVSRGKTNLHHQTQHDIVRNARDIDETLLGDSSYAERHIGSIGNKSNHLRYSDHEARSGLGDIGSASHVRSAVGSSKNRVSRRIVHSGGMNMDIGEPDNAPMHVDMMSSRI